MEAQWESLNHAYGSAADIPGLLLQARTDLRSGHEPGSAWFSLWSALCHQGDIFTASYAAVPDLIELAQLPSYVGHYDPLWLAAHIELARLEGRGPGLPVSLISNYRRSIELALQISLEAAKLPLEVDARQAFAASAAIFSGDIDQARELLDQDG